MLQLQVAKLSHQHRPEFSEAHRKFLTTISPGAEAASQRKSKQAHEKLQQAYAQLQDSSAAAQAMHDSKVQELTAQHSTELAELQTQHAAQATEWEAALARHDSDSKLFKYAVRGSSGPHLSGSVPFSIFQAEPNSALACTYNGEWQYAKDREGRAVVNSDPENWPVILNWLSFGAIPSTPTDSLLAECRYWQLDRLLAAIEDKADSIGDDDAGLVQTTKDSCHLRVKRTSLGSCNGCSVKGMVHNFAKQLSAATDTASQFSINFTAAGRDWSLKVHQMGFYLHMLTGPKLTRVLMRVQWGCGAKAVRRETQQEKVLQGDERTWGWECKADDMELLMHPSMLSMQGSLQLTVEVTYKP